MLSLQIRGTVSSVLMVDNYCDQLGVLFKYSKYKYFKYNASSEVYHSNPSIDVPCRDQNILSDRIVNAQGYSLVGCLNSGTRTLLCELH